jgi:cytochrome c-type biogenesis protein CcmH/NrfG
MNKSILAVVGVGVIGVAAILTYIHEHKTSPALDILVSAKSGYPQKQATWKQLQDTHKLDQLIVELEQQTKRHPRAAIFPAVLGRAYLEKCSTLHDIADQGILAMQADKSFDAALRLDPSNMEARFTKAVAMSYWPPFLNKGQEVIDNFETLIQQQEAQPPQPQFAQTYAWLGDQYQKSGNERQARTVWQHGAELYPADASLRQKLAKPAVR